MIAADGSCAVAQKMMYLNDSISIAAVDQIYIQLDKPLVENVSAIMWEYYLLPYLIQIINEGCPSANTIFLSGTVFWIFQFLTHIFHHFYKS